MKVLMVMQHVNFFRNLDTVTRELHTRGHEVVLLHGTRVDNPKTRNKNARLEDPKTKEHLARKVERHKGRVELFGRGLKRVQSDIPDIDVGYRPEPPEFGHRLLRLGRQVINRSIYFRENHPSPDRVTEGLERDMLPSLRWFVRTRLAKTLLGRRAVLSLWRRIEAACPPSRKVEEVLREIQPDVVLVSPTIWPKDPVESDYIRAARSLGIPSIGYVNSWDNLTSKGTVHVMPDLYIVWNEPIANEAIELHDIPCDIIRTTGAPHLDRFFEMSPTVTASEICKQMGCDPTKPYVVYLCSSRTLMASEVDVASALAEALARQFPRGAPTLVVRPHPTNPGPWEGYEHRGVVVYPKQGDQADCPEAWQEYFNQLSNACCVFGLNTTAFLESVVANRPCLTIVADRFYPAQGKTGHFRHLLKANFLEVSRSVTEVAARVARILEGADENAQGRRFFLQWFLRPCGAQMTSTVAVVEAIESVVPEGAGGSRRRASVSRESASSFALATGDASR